MGALHSALVAQSNHLIKGSRCLTYRPSDDGVIHVYDEMPALRSHSHEGEAPGSVHVRILWLEIDTNDCQQVESKLRLASRSSRHEWTELAFGRPNTRGKNHDYWFAQPTTVPQQCPPVAAKQIVRLDINGDLRSFDGRNQFGSSGKFRNKSIGQHRSCGLKLS